MEQMLTPLERSVVRIYSKNEKVVGAGFLVFQTYILTCTHVLASALAIKRTTTEIPTDEITIDFPRINSKKKLKAKIVFWQPVDSTGEDEQEDIAGLELIDSLPPDVKPARLVTGDNFSDHQFEAFGFPSGNHNGTWASGVLKKRIANGRVQVEDVKQTGYRLEPGFSGTPIWDKVLEGVVGIAVSADLNRPEIKAAFIIPADILVRTWSKLIPQANIRPYQGLLAFKEENAQFFFGRDRFKKDLIQAVETQSLVTVIGPSGSGKSSLVFAGLIPYLIQKGNWIISNFRPKSDPVYEFLVTSVRLLDPSIKDPEQLIHAGRLKQELQEGRLSIRQIVDRILEKDLTKKLLLVIDQFEELYTLCKEEQQRHYFLDQLLEALESHSNFTVVLTLRADFLGYALSYRPLADIIPAADQMLGPMNLGELREAIEKPIENLAMIEEGLTERILEDLKQEPGNLPLLEFTLTLLWDRKEYGWLTHRAYGEIGGVEKALAQYAEEQYKQLNEVEQKRAKKIFIQLVRPGNETQDTRRLATRSEVGYENWDIVTRLADARLVVTGRDDSVEVGEETVEVVHEALIREWARLKRWINTERNFRLWQERLQSTYRKWRESNQSEDALLQGIQLSDAEDWLQRRADEINPKQQGFIKQSIRLRDRKRRRTVYTLSGFSTVVSILGLLAGYSAISQANAKVNAQFALSEARFALYQRLDALNEGIFALREMNKLQNWGIASRSTQSRAKAVLPKLVYGVREQNRFDGHGGKVEGVSFSPDGKYIVSSSEDRTVKVWNPQGLLLATLEGHSSWVNKSIFSPDSSLLATASSDKAIKLWKFDCLVEREQICVEANASLINTLEGHEWWVTDVSFSPDGEILVSSSRDGTIKFWDQQGKLLNSVAIDSETEEQQEVWSVEFSPDGTFLATGNQDKTLKLIDLDGNIIETLKGHSNRVRDVSFSADSEYIASGGDDNTAIIWTRDGKLLRRLEEHTGNVNRVSFTNDNQVLATVTDGESNNVKLWSFDGALLATLNGHTERVKDVRFSPDEKTLVTGGWDNTVRLWDIDGLFPKTLLGHSDRAVDVSFSPDGEILASSGWDSTTRLWNLKGSTFPKVLQHAQSVNATLFSPDNQSLITVGADGNIRLFDFNGVLTKTIKGHDDFIRDASFSPDSQFFITGGGEKEPTIKIWDRKGQLIRTMNGHSDAIYGLSFSPDGQLIASASKDNTIKLWNIDGQLIKTLQGHSGWVWNVSFSPDGQTIASASEDHSVILWSSEGSLLKTLQDHSARVTDVTFSPDGEIIATGSADSTIKLWSLEGELIATLEGHKDRVMSVHFNPDGKLLASSSVDGDVKLWDIGAQDLTVNLDTLLNAGCSWISDYLRTNQALSEDERTLCRGISQSER